MGRGNERSMRRRKVLRTAALSGLGTAGLASVATADARESKAEEEFHQYMMRSREVHNRFGPEAASSYLERNGVSTYYTRQVVDGSRALGTATTSGDADGGKAHGDFCVEPDKCDGDIDLTLRISTYYNVDKYNVSLSMRYRYKKGAYGRQRTCCRMCFGPRSPVDGAGIMWERDHWKLEDRNDVPSSTAGDDHVAWDNGSWNYEGVGFRVDSHGMAMDSEGETSYYCYERNKRWSDTEFADVYLKKGEDWERGDSVHAAYEYTWDQGTVDGVSVGYPWSVSVSASSDTKTEDLQTDLDGNSLLVTASDA